MQLIGFCGLPNVGKSTFLKLLSKVETEIAPYPFTTLKPKEVVAPVLTKELKQLHQKTQTQELRPAFLKFLDVPGLIRGAHKGEGLGNEFLSYLRQCDVILEIVRDFQNPNVPHTEGTIEPQRDILIIEEEIIEAEKRIIQNNISKLKKTSEKTASEQLVYLENILQRLKPFQRFPEFAQQLKEYNLLLTKDWFLILNAASAKIEKKTEFEKLCFRNIYSLDFLFELELEENQELKKEFQGQIEAFLNQFRQDLKLVQFFTLTGEITQSWFIAQGQTVFAAAALIHTDFQKNFLKAEIVSLADFQTAGDWQKAKELGNVVTAGRDCTIEENNIIKIITKQT